MRPLKLEVQGFTAFRELQIVDFEDLDLFVIVGPTGAGKTSLLDAMIYALFGEVPRMGKQGLSDLISQGLTEARIKFEFASGGDRYRVARRVKRNGASSATFERADGEDWLNDVDGSGVRAVDRRIVDLLKLGFDAFTRAVVLPQGEFQRFLRGEVGERRQILTALLGLDHYVRMGARARGRAAELQVGVETTEQILANQYADATAERIDEAEKAQEHAAQRASELETALEGAVALDGKAADLRAIHGSLSELSGTLAGARAVLEEKLEACEAAKVEEIRLTEAAEQAQAHCSEASAGLETAQAELSDLTKKYGTLEEIVRAEGAVQAREESSQELEGKQSRLDALAGELETLGGQIKGAQETVGALEAKHETLQASLKTALDNSQQLNRAADEVAGRVKQAENATRAIGTAEEELTRCKESLDKSCEARATAKHAADAAEEACQALTQAQSAAALAQDLKVGDPCPVCHQVLEKAPDVDKHVAKELSAAAKRRTAANQALEKAIETERQARSTVDGAELLVRQANETLTVALADAESLEVLSENAAAAQEAAASADAEATGLQSQIEETRTALGEAKVVRAQLTSSLTSTTEAKDQLASDCEQLHRRLEAATTILGERFGKRIPADAGDQLAARREALKSAQAAVDDAQTACNEAQTVLQGANESLAVLQRQLSELDSAIAGQRARCEAANESIVTALQKIEGADGAQSLPVVVDVRAENVKALASWCEATDGLLTRADGLCNTSLEALDGELVTLVQTHQIEHLADQSPIEAIKAAEQAAREEKVRTEEAARQARKRLQEREDLMASIADKRSEIQLLKALSAELRADRFVQFIIQQTLDLLAVRASDQLMRISAQRYSLSSHDGEFYVVDHVNADEQRTVKTLSGGETFLASLSLALALSQHVGDLATEGLGAKLEAVFIDEGFGALDPETLEDVIDALERLREGDLMVGVITHVPALAERIRVGVRVAKGNNQSEVVLSAN